MLLIGSRHRRDSCSEAYRFARSGPSQPTRRSTSTSRTPLMGFTLRPFADTTVTASTPAWAVAQTSVRDCHVPNVFRSCRSSRLQRFSPQRADPKIHPSTACGFVAPRNRPWGSPRFGLPGSASRPSLDPKVADPKVRRESSPWRTPFEAFPSSTAFDHAVTARRPFGLGRVHRLACPLAVSSHARYRVATVRRSARRPQGLLPSRSPLQARDVSAARPLDAPLGFGSTRSRCCRAFRAAQTRWTFRLAGQPLRRPRPERRGKARCFGLVWLRATDGRSSPKGGPRAVAVAPAPPEGGTSAASHMGPEGIGGMPVDQPGGGSTASVQRPKAQGADVIATHLRRDSCATQCSLRRAAPVVRASALRPLALARVHDGEPARRGRPHPEVRSSARHSRAPRRALRSNLSAGIPKDSDRRASRGQPEGHSWRLVAPACSSKLESRSRARQSFVITGTAESRSRRTGTLSDPEIGESAPKRRGCGW